MKNAGRSSGGLGTVLAGLLILFPATSRGQSDGRGQDGGFAPDGGVVADAEKAPSNVHVQIGGSILPRDLVYEAVGPAPPNDANLANLAEWAAMANCCWRSARSERQVMNHQPVAGG